MKYNVRTKKVLNKKINPKKFQQGLHKRDASYGELMP